MKRKINIDKTISEIKGIHEGISLDVVRSWVWTYQPTDLPTTKGSVFFNWSSIFKSRIN